MIIITRPNVKLLSIAAPYRGSGNATNGPPPFHHQTRAAAQNPVFRQVGTAPVRMDGAAGVVLLFWRLAAAQRGELAERLALVLAQRVGFRSRIWRSEGCRIGAEVPTRGRVDVRLQSLRTNGFQPRSSKCMSHS